MALAVHAQRTRIRVRLSVVVTVQARRAVAGALHAAAGVNNRLRCRNLAAEVRRIQGATQNRLVHLTQRARVNSSPKKECAIREYLDLVLQAVERVLNDFVVVEGELGQLIDREPTDVLVHAGVCDLGGGNRRQYTTETTRS